MALFRATHRDHTRLLPLLLSTSLSCCPSLSQPLLLLNLPHSQLARLLALRIRMTCSMCHAPSPSWLEHTHTHTYSLRDRLAHTTLLNNSIHRLSHGLSVAFAFTVAVTNTKFRSDSRPHSDTATATELQSGS